MALVGGLQAVPGVVMGHAGASVQYHNEDALSKIKALESAGVAVTDHPSKFGNLMKGLLEKNSYTDKSLVKHPEHFFIPKILTRRRLTTPSARARERFIHFAAHIIRRSSLLLLLACPGSNEITMY